MAHDVPVVKSSIRPNQFLLISNLISQLSQSATQIRGFKTQRNIESQLKRNPSFLSRFQQAIGKAVPSLLFNFYPKFIGILQTA